MQRTILFYGNYFIEFYSIQDEKLKTKIKYVFQLIRQTNQVPEKFFKHLTGTNGLYEIRVEYKSNIYIIFCCFDEGSIIVLLNVFQKKTQKTPKSELEKGLKLMEDYFKLKK